MAVNPKSLANLRPAPWKPGQSGNPKGRPKKYVDDSLVKLLGKAQAKRLMKMNAQDIDEWDRVLLSMNAKELIAVANSNEVCVYAKTNANAILTDLKHGTAKVLSQLRDRVAPVTNKIELSGENPFAQKSTEEIMAEIAEIESQMNK